MHAPPAPLQSQNYFVQLFGLTTRSLKQLAGPPSHQHRAAAAARHALRQAAWLAASGAVLIIVLMVGFDATEIALMPPRGTPGLYPVRVVTDFGKDEYVISVLVVVLLVTAVVLPLSRARARVVLLRFGARIQYLLLAVSVPVLVTEIIKWVVGRGRPFVGGKANPFNFAPFNGTEAYFSFPSAHAVTAFALAFGVAVIWPQTRMAMVVYAVIIAVTRLVLLAHHPSDVVAGAVLGLVGAIAVQYWFAARRIGFVIGRDGRIVVR
jgi:membrane-associated phospholipid phosphatase